MYLQQHITAKFCLLAEVKDTKELKKERNDIYSKYHLDFLNMCFRDVAGNHFAFRKCGCIKITY